MRYIVLSTAMAFIGGLFVAGMALGAGEYKSGSKMGSSSQMGKGEHQQQQYGSTSQRGQQQQQMAGQQLGKEQVKELQQKLNEEGFAAGPVDGIVGPKTRGAIQSFQRQEGIAATGQPDQQTLEALDIDVEGQEFFGVSPEFGEEQQQKQTEEQQMQQMEQQQREQPYQQQQQQRQQQPGTMESK